MYCARLFILYRLGSHTYIIYLYYTYISYRIWTSYIFRIEDFESRTYTQCICIPLWVIVSLAKLFFLPKISSDLPCRPVIDNTIATATPCLLPAWQSSPKTPPHLPLIHTRAHPFIPRRESVQMMYRRAAVPRYLVGLTVNGKRPK